MAAPIQQLARLASRTFSRLNTSEGVQPDKISQLKSALGEITAADVNFDANFIKQRDSALASRARAPVTYIHLWEDDTFSMGIFVVKGGGRLPLHDHPGMFGLIKVIHGTLKIISLSEVEGVPVPDDVNMQVKRWQKPRLKSVTVDREGIVSSGDGCCQLTPSRGNFHEITAVSDVAAFVDILAPPYNKSQDRDCHYYSEVLKNSASASARNVKWLIPVPQPLDFWCDTVDYTGPHINVRA
ncbi:hypothetical protein BaRGS_00040255 [Batillaria attramentaria]|uniref:Cysteine dioxygenase n=1 Tax=Batillaria attramentaria TaxID=370345 RepID=A0ABD0J0W6_9CAEN